MRKIRFKIIILNLCKLFKSVLVKLNTPDSLAIGKNTIENFLINEFGLKSNEIFKLNSFVTSRIKTKVFDCFIFDNEIELLDLRLNEYYDKIDFFIIIEFSKTNTGYIKETSIFEKNINIWKKFSDKILYKYVNFNEIPNFSESKNNNIEIFCKNYIDIILRKIASSGDNIFISDIGQLWNIDKIEEACTSDGIVLFVQNWYDYFINYKRNNYLIGTFKYNYGTLSLQEARNLAFKINNYIVHKDMRNIIEISNLTYSTYFKLICDGGGYYNEFYDIKIADNHKNETDYSHNLSYSTETHGNISISCKSISQPPKKMGYFLEKYSNFYKPVNTKEIKKSVEIIGLIYSSIDLLKMMYNELLKIKNSNKEWNIGIKIVANDATTEVIQYLKENNIPHIIFNNINKNEYYINRIYKAYNHAAFISQYDNVIFINSDMIFGNNWFANLVKHHDGINIPVSRLIEYGNLNTCSWCLLSKCGNIFDHEINYKKFYNLEKLISTNKVLYTGIYMPVIFEKHRFIESGGYPNGNVNIRGNITKNNKQIYKTGDRWFFENILFEKFGMNHITVCDSICYHIQEGEIRSKNKLD